MNDTGENELDRMARRASEGFASFSDVGVSRIFGTPVEAAGRIVIPAAAFDVGGGFGFGGGGDEHGSGGGGGGGGYTKARPMAVIEVTADGVRVKPVLDWTRLGLMALTTALTVWRASRRHA